MRTEARPDVDEAGGGEARVLGGGVVVVAEVEVTEDERVGDLGVGEEGGEGGDLLGAALARVLLVVAGEVDGGAVEGAAGEVDAAEEDRLVGGEAALDEGEGPAGEEEDAVGVDAVGFWPRGQVVVVAHPGLGEEGGERGGGDLLEGDEVGASIAEEREGGGEPALAVDLLGLVEVEEEVEGGDEERLDGLDAGGLGGRPVAAVGIEAPAGPRREGRREGGGPCGGARTGARLGGRGGGRGGSAGGVDGRVVGGLARAGAEEQVDAGVAVPDAEVTGLDHVDPVPGDLAAGEEVEEGGLTEALEALLVADHEA